MKKINRILVANRGEIASRIFRTCKLMGITSIAVYSEADRTALFVKEADVAVFIGDSEPNKSYLDQDKIIAAAKKTGADAIHPGYGFLSENSVFAEKCATEGIIFIGPNPKAIQAMGSKSQAKYLMEKAGVPVIAGYKGTDQSEKRLIEEALKIGFPLLLKAAAGGGGRGMRIVNDGNSLEKAIQAAKSEAKNAFGDDELIIEKYIASGRHIEFQIFGDQYGNVIHLLERECTIQRRYQKVIEESPSPIMIPDLREKMGEAAVQAAKVLNYDNAGTVEFIFDDKTGAFYFLEVNTRLQVEHPVTEEITGLDLVQMQIESAKGYPLSITQSEVTGKGYAIEARLYAEDAAHNFSPATGTIHNFKVPTAVQGLRIETAIDSGSTVSVYYDPMIAKIIVWDKTRAAAHDKLEYVLENMVCQGITTNQTFLLTLLQHEDFRKGNYDTHFINNKIALSDIGKITTEQLHEAAIAATLYDWQQRNTDKKRNLLRGLPSGWRNSLYDFQKENYHFDDVDLTVKYRYLDGSFLFKIENKTTQVSICQVFKDTIRLEIDGVQKDFSVVAVGNNRFLHSSSFGHILLMLKDRFPKKEKEILKGGYEAPIPSQIIKILVKEGDKVALGDALIIISSMKMENTICATEGGIVESIFAEVGKNVEAGFVLLTINDIKNEFLR